MHSFIPSFFNWMTQSTNSDLVSFLCTGDARALSTGTLNAFVRALQLSEALPSSPTSRPFGNPPSRSLPFGRSVSSPTTPPPTRPPTKFRFQTDKPSDGKPASRITYIPQVSQMDSYTLTLFHEEAIFTFILGRQSLQVLPDTHSITKGTWKNYIS